jgi:archaemetzincin
MHREKKRRGITIILTEELSEADSRPALNVLNKLGEYLHVKESKKALSLQEIPSRATSFGKQYFADILLRKALQRKESDLVLVLTSVDIYTVGTNYIFGLAAVSAGIVSSARIDPSFWKGADEICQYTSRGKPFFEKQFSKVIVHEVGHSLGLAHCENWDCVMHFANSPLELYRKGEWYCQACQNELPWNNTMEQLR